jgi:hypothetical protein
MEMLVIGGFDSWMAKRTDAMRAAIEWSQS